MILINDYVILYVTLSIQEKNLKALYNKDLKGKYIYVRINCYVFKQSIDTNKQSTKVKTQCRRSTKIGQKYTSMALRPIRSAAKSIAILLTI